MNISYLRTGIATAVAMTLVGVAVTAMAEMGQEETARSAMPAATAKTAAPKGVPYGGVISAVDKTAMTVTVKKKEAAKTFTVNAATRIHKAGQPASLDDAVVGEEAGVSYVETDGRAEALSLRLGPKPEKSAGRKQKTEEGME